MDKQNNPNTITSFTLPELLALAGADTNQGLMGECLTASSASRMEEFRRPSRIDAFIIGVGTEGETCVSFNMREYRLRKNSMFIYAPKNIIQVHSDVGFVAHVIAISPDMMRRINIDIKQMMPLLVQFATHPCLELTEAQSQLLRNFISLIEGEVNQRATLFAEEILSGLISATIYKVGEMLHHYLEEHPEQKALESNRAEAYFRQFMQLLNENFRTERSVGFYAQQLCITPKYFTTLIKRLSGKSVSEWIDSYVILEAKTLLRYSNMSIQEIAYHLHFPNQSFFGCFFKRNTGMSPSQYKVQKE